MPAAPPTTPSVPNVPLCTLLTRRRSTPGSAVASALQSSRYPRAGIIVSMSRPSVWTDTVPQQSTPSPVSSPGFSAMNVAVAAARIVGFIATPVSASRPLGTSSARTGTAVALVWFDQRRVIGGQRALEADPEESIDDERASPIGRNVGERRAAGGDEGAMRDRGVSRQVLRVGAKHDRRLVEPLAHPACDDERVAAVVAGTGEDEDLAATIAGERPCGLRRREPGTLHQRQRARPILDRAQVDGAIDGREPGRGSHRRIIGGATALTRGTPSAKWTNP